MTDNKYLVSASSQPGGAVSIEAAYSGVLPPPEVVHKYEQMLPGSAREILDMAKAQQSHRHELEIREQAHRHKTANGAQGMQALGQMISGFIILAVIGGAFYMILEGKSLEGLATLLVPLGGVAGVVLYGQRHKAPKTES